ncbi:OB-fold putative lipoprotein [Arachidicoccus terrestris]|uniref:OB-fold putative lipoprotein n=1 Tax=Arachidicoccus terrestris TaxID=2875539 RepID=UPI001CC72FB7|nr:OB-fold putative lipoprotein [Arachidicoccus terrestris]UAY56591.1 OB-fold putative lipoprotein [Arachidicoccus terrestris]
MKKVFFFVGGSLCLVIAIFWFWRLYHEQRPLLKSERAAADVHAAALYQAFAANEDSANKLYLGKILEVEGQITGKMVDGDHVAVQMGRSELTGGGVNCALRFPKDSAVQIGERVRVKGRCAGFLMDVNLTDVEIIK